MTERTASWIRALWPPAVASVAVIALIAGLLSRLDTAEACITDHETRIRNLEEVCAAGAAAQQIILDELRWMREHWPTTLPASPQ